MKAERIVVNSLSYNSLLEYYTERFGVDVATLMMSESYIKSDPIASPPASGS